MLMCRIFLVLLQHHFFKLQFKNQCAKSMWCDPTDAIDTCKIIHTFAIKSIACLSDAYLLTSTKLLIHSEIPCGHSF